MQINEAKILAYNQRKTTRLYIEVAYSKINYISINRHVDIPPQYDQVIRNVLNWYLYFILLCKFSCYI